MKIDGIIWLRDIVDKLDIKHNVSTSEVEEVFWSKPRYRYIERGNVAGEDLYVALGQTDAARYLVIFFVHKPTDEALIISARDMTTREKKSYGQ